MNYQERNQTQLSTNQLSFPNKTMTDTAYVSYTAFDYQKVKGMTPQTKTIPNQPNPNQVYFEIPIQYNYGTEENPHISDLFIEWPEVTSYGGILEMQEQSGKDGRTRVSYAIKCMLNTNQNPEIASLIQLLKELHHTCSHIIAHYKAPLKMYEFNPQQPGSVFTNPIRYPRDQTTGELIEGRSPFIYLKLFKRGFGVSEEKTLFTDLEANPIDWNLLKGVEIKFIPLVHVEKIYVGGGRASLQLKITSAVVTWVAAKNTVTRQIETINNYKMNNPQAQNALSEQIVRLSNMRKDLFKTQALVPLIPPMSSGLSDPGTGVMHNLTASTSNLNDFLASAPGVPKSVSSAVPKSASPKLPGVVKLT